MTTTAMASSSTSTTSTPTLYDAHLSQNAKDLREKLIHFVQNECIPSEPIFDSQLPTTPFKSRWSTIPPILNHLKARAKQLGLWNLFLPKHFGKEAGSHGLSNVEYAALAEVMGRSFLAPEACNCSAPDTGNMEVLLKYGTPSQQKQWLQPLLNGEIRSAFCMTEPGVASSDALNISTTIVRHETHYSITGRKWWITGAGDPRCKILLVFGKAYTTTSNSSTPVPISTTKHATHSVILVPMNTPGIRLIRPLTAFGYDDAPFGHYEILFENVHVPLTHILSTDGAGFKIIQSRLGPGRLHHCMRAVGMGERCLESLLYRVTDPARISSDGKLLIDRGVVRQWIAECRILLEQSRLLVLNAAYWLDRHEDDNSSISKQSSILSISTTKSFIPSAISKIIDYTIQVHGAGGLSEDFPFARLAAGLRSLRFADGPDEVHVQTIAKLEMKKIEGIRKKFGEVEKMKVEMEKRSKL